jgi:general L-amino acid transport system permease protein
MTTFTDPPKESFRLSQLIYDTRYRSLTIQVIAAILIVLSLSWLVSNTIENLRILGKDFNFGFLFSRAGYDINQRIIEYSADSTHGRAALVGILNTLAVAVLGCVLATVIGVVMGVLRLSNNWIVARLSAVYVEGFRNVPLLLWIIAIFAVLSESLPQPRDFRGDDGASMLFADSVAITGRGTYIPAPVFGDGALALIAVFIVAVGGAIFLRRQSIAKQEETGREPLSVLAVIGIVIGVTGLFYCLQGGLIITLFTLVKLAVLAAIGAVAWAFQARVVKDLPIPTAAQTAAGVGFVIAVLGVWMFWLAPTVWTGVQSALGLSTEFAPSLTFEKPYLKGFNFADGIFLRNSLLALWIALSLYTGAFIAEIVRAGILSVSKGQSEASFALGLSPNRTMNLVILPQALRVIIPPLISQFLNLTKNSSLAIAVGYMDVRSTLGGITVNQTGRELEGLLLVGVFYLVTSLLIAAVMNVYNNSVKLKER